MVLTAEDLFKLDDVLLTYNKKKRKKEPFYLMLSFLLSLDKSQTKAQKDLLELQKIHQQKYCPFKILMISVFSIISLNILALFAN